jgi:hypothetical protein
MLKDPLHAQPNVGLSVRLLFPRIKILIAK